MSLSSELIFGCVHMFATTLEPTKGTMPSSFFMKFFKKIMITVLRPIAHAKGFFDGNS
jgi:hypothetical protein